MRSHTPNDKNGRGGRTTPMSNNRFRASTSNVGPQPSLRNSRMSFRASTQPSYNLLTGESNLPRPASRTSMAPESVRPSSRESHKENMPPPEADESEKEKRQMEALKAEIGTLQYRLQTTEQEKGDRPVDKQQQG
ncbi:hypothetical protein NXS19_008467 [Fusarium pseudograminearum]|nr:hypothetical protein NXS19_008467 [Fusarium pseudograminearum]